MKSVPFKYGLVIGVLTTVIYFLMAWLMPSLTLKLLPYAMIFGVTFALVLFYNITKKKELKDTEIIQYHEAFISSFVIGFIGMLIFNVSSILVRGFVFPEIPEMQKELTLKGDDAAIDYFKKDMAKNGNKNHSADNLTERLKMKKDNELREFNPVKRDVGMSFVGALAFSGVFAAFFAIIISFFGMRSKPILNN